MKATWENHTSGMRPVIPYMWGWLLSIYSKYSIPWYISYANTIHNHTWIIVVAHLYLFFYQVTCNSYMTIVVSKFIDVTPVSRVSMYCCITSPTYLEIYAYLRCIYCILVYLKVASVMLPIYIYITIKIHNIVLVHCMFRYTSKLCWVHTWHMM